MEKINEKFVEELREKYKDTPMPLGVHNAYWTYRDGKFGWKTRAGRKLTAYGFSGFCWTKDVPDFISTLRKIGIKRFVFTNTSTAVMRNLHEFGEQGCYIGGLVTMTDEFFEAGTEGIVICLREQKGN